MVTFALFLLFFSIELDVREWLICTAAALSIVVAAEARKAVLRRTAAKAIRPASAPRAGDTTPEHPAGA